MDVYVIRLVGQRYMLLQYYYYCNNLYRSYLKMYTVLILFKVFGCVLVSMSYYVHRPVVIGVWVSETILFIIVIIVSRESVHIVTQRIIWHGKAIPKLFPYYIFVKLKIIKIKHCNTCFITHWSISPNQCVTFKSVGYSHYRYQNIKF